MNRKELACAAVGAVLGVAGCSPAMKSLAVPVANADETATVAGMTPAKIAPHIEEVLLSLISGTTKDIASAVVHLAPKSGWSIASNDPRLQVEIQNGHAAILQAPEDKKVHFIAVATISHEDGTEFRVRCHVEESC